MQQWDYFLDGRIFGTFLPATLGHYFVTTFECFSNVGTNNECVLTGAYELSCESKPGTDSSCILLVPRPGGTTGAAGPPSIIDWEDVTDSRKCVRITVSLDNFTWQQEMLVETIDFKNIIVKVANIQRIMAEVYVKLRDTKKDIQINANIRKS